MHTLHTDTDCFSTRSRIQHLIANSQSDTKPRSCVFVCFCNSQQFLFGTKVIGYALYLTVCVEWAKRKALARQQWSPQVAVILCTTSQRTKYNTEHTLRYCDCMIVTESTTAQHTHNRGQQSIDSTVSALRSRAHLVRCQCLIKWAARAANSI